MWRKCKYVPKGTCCVVTVVTVDVGAVSIRRAGVVTVDVVTVEVVMVVVVPRDDVVHSTSSELSSQSPM